MEKEGSRTELGTVRVHKNVIASIASLAAAEIEGVKRVGGDLKSGIAEFIGQKHLFAIGVEISKNEEVKIEIPLVIKYGYNIPEIAGRVQENVRNSLEKMTSLSVKDINVNIKAIERG
ncbi:MAG: Asp23/Gls24 family envelope stress response protein [Candidatus Omnitrophota bacterium]